MAKIILTNSDFCCHLGRVAKCNHLCGCSIISSSNFFYLCCYFTQPLISSMLSILFKPSRSKLLCLILPLFHLFFKTLYISFLFYWAFVNFSLIFFLIFSHHPLRKILLITFLQRTKWKSKKDTYHERRADCSDVMKEINKKEMNFISFC